MPFTLQIWVARTVNLFPCLFSSVFSFSCSSSLSSRGKQAVFEKCNVAIVGSLAMWRYGKVGLHRFCKKSTGHLQNLGSERWQEASSILRIYKYLAPVYKIQSPRRPGDRDMFTSPGRIITDILCQPLPFVHKMHIFLSTDSECFSVPGTHWCDGIAVRSFTQHELDLLNAASLVLCCFLLWRLQWAYNCLTHWGRGHLDCLNARSRGLNNLN